MASSALEANRPVSRWAALVVPLICWLALISDGYDLFSYGATLPGLIDTQPWFITAGQGGLVGSLSLVGMLCGSLVAGTLTDILGRRRLFLFSVVLFSVAMLGCAFSPSFVVFGDLPLPHRASVSAGCCRQRWRWRASSPTPAIDPGSSVPC